MPADQHEFLTVGIACAVLGVSPNTLRAWGATGKISEYRHAVNNYRLFRRHDVEKLKSRLAKPKRVNRGRNA